MSTSSSRRQRTRYEPTGAAPVVWLVGDWDAGEFAAVRRRLDPAGEWAWASELDEATASAAVGVAIPEAVLLAQPRPGCIEQAAVDRLLAAAPLVRVVVVAGSWCEGELRTGKPLLGAIRLYWHELPAWWERSLARQRAGLAPFWSGPTGNNAEDDGDGDGRGVTVAVDAIDYAAFEALEAALRPHGMECLWTSRGRGDVGGATLGIWDGGQLDDEGQAALAAFCRRLGGAPVIALLDYPRAEHSEIARSAGAAGVLGKPYVVASLVHELCGDSVPSS